MTALFGPSGCGKTTLLAAVAGLLRPQAGRVALRRHARCWTPRAASPCRRSGGAAAWCSRMRGCSRISASRPTCATACAARRADADRAGAGGGGGAARHRPAARAAARPALGRGAAAGGARPRPAGPAAPAADGRAAGGAGCRAAGRGAALPGAAARRGRPAHPLRRPMRWTRWMRWPTGWCCCRPGGSIAEGTVEALSLRTDLPLAGGAMPARCCPASCRRMMPRAG